MKHRYGLAFLLIWLPVILSIRIPPNPCPDMFNYYKNYQGAIYGEARMPYDNATLLVFKVNASMVGNFSRPKLKLKLVTKVQDFIHGTSHVIYNIFFPFNNVIPKITKLTYNNRTYCSGPNEPIIPGEPGITKVWSQLSILLNPKKFTDIPDDIPLKSGKETPTANPPLLKPVTQRITPVSPQVPPQQTDPSTTPDMDIPNKPPAVPNPTDPNSDPVNQNEVA
ncbi:uncharacterized protein LOC114324801 [Diabrotica virgifera virgifera]|uniref:Serine protease gd N-terminal domain-containing protein n=1 Tax=Diabrotica virgifera virgifera TaxID=50390 RepID=A0ABM5KMJ1_DIAVI|nr:uncharacterized protein LOC114324801 [Diabrotica virgifera virgifera]